MSRQDLEHDIFAHTYQSNENTLGSGIAVSVQGARHVQHESLCQDASAYTVNEDVVFMGVADGHGDSKHALSHIGSELALKVAEPILTDLYRTLDINLLKRDASTLSGNIEKRIRWEWNLACKRYLKQQSTLSIDNTVDGAWHKDLIQFGTTLLCCCYGEQGVLYFQLGDGDIAWLTNDAETVANAKPKIEFAFAEPEDVTGTITQSLCRPYEENISHCRFIPTLQSKESKAQPVMILLSTDGIRDCLQGERSRFSSILPWLLSKRDDDVEQLANWLYKISKHGNGDDISLSIHFTQPQSGEVPDGDA